MNYDECSKINQTFKSRLFKIENIVDQRKNAVYINSKKDRGKELRIFNVRIFGRILNKTHVSVWKYGNRLYICDNKKEDLQNLSNHNSTLTQTLQNEILLKAQSKE